MDEAKTRMNLVFLDACRNNPYAEASARRPTAGQGQRALGHHPLVCHPPGLGRGRRRFGRNGLYTEHLLARPWTCPTKPIEQALKRVVSGVQAGVEGPSGAVDGRLHRRRFLLQAGRAAGAVTVKPPTAAVRVQTPRRSSRSCGTPSRRARDQRDLEDYLKQYPKGRFAPLAAQKLKALASAPAPSKPTTTVASLAPTEERKRHEQEERNKKLVLR